MRIPEPSFKHVLHLTDEHGMFEHADGVTPRYDGGYCLDDVARALVVVCRQRPQTPTLERLAASYLAFVVRAQAPDGRCHNRMDRAGSVGGRAGQRRLVGTSAVGSRHRRGPRPRPRSGTSRRSGST